MQKIRDWLYIGKYFDTTSKKLLKNHGITAMLQLAEPVTQAGIDSRFVPIYDGKPIPEEAIEEAIDYINAKRDDGERLLISCGAGVSRSATFCMAALMEAEGLSMMEAYRVVYREHPDALPHFELLISLAEHYGQTLEKVDAWTQLQKIQDEVDREES